MIKYDTHWTAIDNRGNVIGHATRPHGRTQIHGRTYSPSGEFTADCCRDMRYAFRRAGAAKIVRTHEDISRYQIIA